MKQVVIKRLLKQVDSTLNRQFEDFAGFYGFKPILCRPYRGQTKGKVECTVQFVLTRLSILSITGGFDFSFQPSIDWIALSGFAA